MANLVNEDRPAGQSARYRFVRNEETGTRFKVAQEGRVDANGRPAICISVAPVGEDGKALLDPRGEPDVHWHTHSFTDEELNAPDFDFDARVATVIHEAATAKERHLVLRSKLGGLATRWSARADIPLDKTIPGVVVIPGARNAASPPIPSNTPTMTGD